MVANGDAAYLPSLIEETMTIEYLGLISNNNPELEKNDYFFYRDCVFGKYNKICELAVDGEILRSLLRCESIFLKMMERFENWNALYGYEHRINLYHKQVSYWYSYLINNKITTCVFMTIPHFGFDFVIYSLCKLLDIKVVMFQRIPVLIGSNVSLYAFDDLDTHIAGLKETYQYFLENPDDIELDSSFSAYSQLSDSNVGKTFTGAPEKSKNYFSFISKALMKVIIRLHMLDLFKKHISWRDLFSRSMQFLSLFERFSIKYDKNPNLNDRFIFVPLHYQPEASTSTLGGVYVHQDIMINMLDKIIPKDILIYIKPHPRPGNINMFLRRVGASERFIFVDPGVNSLDLVKNSLAVATVTGTAGWEAVINKKPVLMFGNYFYQDAPGVYKISSTSELDKAVSHILKNKNLVQDININAFLAALQKHTFPGWVDNRYSKISKLTAAENNRNLAKEIINRVNE